MVKCELMEPRIGTGYTFSERGEFYGPRKYSKNNNKPRLGEQGSLSIKIKLPRLTSRRYSAAKVQ